MKRILTALLTIIVVCAVGVAGWSIAATSDELVSRPGEYSGYAQVLYDGWQRFSMYVPVSTYRDAPDGTPLENPIKLAIDIYRF